MKTTLITQEQGFKHKSFIKYKSAPIGAELIKQDERVIKGYAAVWGNKDLSGEKLVKGMFAKSISDRGPMSKAKYKITFLKQHCLDEPLALVALLKEDSYGLYFETAPLDDIQIANEVLLQVKSGTLNQFSVGFMPIWDKAEYDESDDSIAFKEGDLYEISVVTIGDNPETYAIKSIKEKDDLFDETENFLSSMPRKPQIEARKLFNKYQSLTKSLETIIEKTKSLKAIEPVESQESLYKYLLENF